VPEHDAHADAEGVRRGGALVTVRASEGEVDRIIDILDDEGTVDLDDRQNTWKSEGWKSPTAGLMGSGSSNTSQNTGMAVGGTGSTGMTGSAGRTTSEGSQVIPVAEEELHVGKRQVSGGRVRIHSHVVERPVQEQVTLREEHVHVERRPVEGGMRTGAVGDRGDLFKERTIEMEERSEEAMVSKEAHVKEELVVKKDVDQRTETISDTVRSTKVEVEDERGKRVTGTTGTTGKDRDRR
jgi:uncharacterized protein (TIGR02271 family)